MASASAASCPHTADVRSFPATCLSWLSQCQTPNCSQANCSAFAAWVCCTCHSAWCGDEAAHHMQAHASDAGHPLGVELSAAELFFCFACNRRVNDDPYIGMMTDLHAAFRVRASGGDPDAMVATLVAQAKAEAEALAAANAGHGFPVVAITDCPHLADSLSAVLNFEPTDPCCDCGNRGENWVCLACSRVFCSRYVQGHMLRHNLQSQAAHPPDGHAVAFSFADQSFWCYACESYIDHPSLFPVKAAVHRRLYNEPYPGQT